MRSLNELRYRHFGTPILTVKQFRDAAKKLKPCPICCRHADLLFFKDPADVLGYFTVRCTGADCENRKGKKLNFRSMEIAIEEWNCRAEAENQVTMMLFDPGEEDPEFTRSQLDQIDAVDNAAYDLAKILCPGVELEWNMEYIGEIADAAQAIMKSKGFKTSYPSITDENGVTKIVDD